MPTRNRRRFVSQAIWYFLRQDYSPCELIVVDDGEDAVGDEIPNDPRIRYVRLNQPLSRGAKRNHACQLATGEVIAHWDDDAWYDAHRLAAQVAQLETPQTGAAALSGLLHYQPVTGRVWRYEARANTADGLHGATLAYRRAYWHAHRFVEDGRDEIAPFIRTARSLKLDIQDGGTLAVALIHGTSGGPVNHADPRWQPRPFDELGRLLELDLTFYAGLRVNGGLAGPRQTVDPITLAATFMVYDGYGSMAEYLALGMSRAGADVHVMPFRIDPTALSAEFQEMWKRSRPDPDGIVLSHAWWGENLARFGLARDLFVKTAWETSRLPADWPARLNQATAVIVPSRFVARVFRESGVRVPVEVVDEGVDPDVYPYQSRPADRGLTTLVVGVLAPRKNFRQAIAAWKLAFADDPDARMILKARFQLERYVPDDPRIRVVDSNEPTRGILHWYRQADVLLALGNEGFGLPLIEGMATGLPAVALDAEAQGDVCADAEGLLCPVPPASWEPASGAACGPCGVRAIPDVEAAARQLRWVAEHRQEAREMGRRASVWAHARRSVWGLGPATLTAMERHAHSSRPLRRSYAVWAPASAGPPAFRYYTDDLVRSLSRTHVYETPPAAWRSQTVHIQHVPTLFDDAELAHHVHAAQHGGAAVIVTEHVVNERAEAWEQRADVLVALDTDSARRLRDRWPGKRVEVIPPACPPWRAATRDGTGRTVAVIDPGDGSVDWPAVWRLASAPGVRLVAFASEPPGGATVPGLVQARHLPLPPSSEELARRLNEEADIALVWKRGASEFPAAYLGRVAVASGVPVVQTGAIEQGLPTVVVAPDDVVAGTLDALQDGAARRAELATAAREFCEASAWPRVAALHHALWRTLWH